MIRAVPPLLFLTAGTLIYWTFRPGIYLFQLIPFDTPHPIAIDGNPLFALLNNHGADLFWCIALLQVARLSRRCGVSRCYTLVLLSLPFASEVLQATPLVPGTFDWIDLTIYLGLYTVAFQREIIEMKQTRRHILGVLALSAFAAGIVGSTNPPARKTSTPSEPIMFTTGTFRIPAAQDEYFTKKSLRRILQTSSTPSIVLRVPVAGKNVAEQVNQKNNVLYNIIEKEFAKAGFAVRDRALFNQMLESERKTYSEIGKATDTDLILELLSFDQIPYPVRQYRDEAGELQEADNDITFTGAKVEFKLISVRENDLVGSYTFNYTPCTFACTHKFNTGVRSTLTVDEIIPADFFKNSAKRLIDELRKVK